MAGVFRWAARIRAAARPVRPTEPDVAPIVDDVPPREATYQIPEPPIDRHPTASALAHQIHQQIGD